MKYSTKVSDAVHIMVYIALSGGCPLSSGKIAESIRTNPGYVRQMMSALRKSGLLSSVKGHPRPALTREPSAITLLDVYKAVEGEKPLLHLDTHTNPECGVGVNIQLALQDYFDQVQEHLDLSKTVIDEVWTAFPFMTETRVRNALAAFLFKGEDVFKKLEVCSGGERARVALLKLMLGGFNFLLLDEPTNHLDAYSREELENTLLDYQGTMLIVSHDRYFINKLATRIVELTPAGCNNFLGNYDDYAQHRYVVKEEKVSQQKPKENSYKLKKELQSSLRKLNTKLKKLEEDIENTETEIDEINDKLNQAGYEELMELTERLNHLTQHRDELYILWEETSTELEEVSSQLD